jgi:hypothetical protein
MKKAPLSFLAGPSVFVLAASDQRAQPPKAPAGLVLSVFLMIKNMGGGMYAKRAGVKPNTSKILPTGRGFLRGDEPVVSGQH